MNQNLRLSLTLFLCAAIYMVWIGFFPPQHKPPVAMVSSEAPTSTLAPATNPLQPQVANIEPVYETKAEPQNVTLKTPKATYVVSNQGGVLVGAQLHDFHATAGDEKHPKNLITETLESNNLFLGFKNLPAFTSDKFFEVVHQNENQVVLKWENSQVRLEKIIQINPTESNYGLESLFKITNLSHQPLELTPYWQNKITQKQIKKRTGVLGFLSKSSTQAEEFMPHYSEKKSLVMGHDWSNFQTTLAQTDWAGIGDRYFLMALKPALPEAQTFRTEYQKQNQALLLNLESNVFRLAPQETYEGKVNTYVGPRQTAELKKLGVGFENAVDYGWFSFLAHPMLWLMQTLHRVIPSWGLAIILLTFIVKILLHPVNKKSMTSMKAMQQLQPKLEEIRKKYPEDKMKQNEEVMHLFKTHNVNPLGGCLPMLMQLPIYVALYRVLLNAIELYQTPFLIYKDLSMPDPYFVAPIILGVMMFLQQKLTPSPSTDPMQKKMMMFMPVMFTGLMLFLPVGLVIYIFVNTSVSVLQQYLLRKDISIRDVILRKLKPAG